MTFIGIDISTANIERIISSERNLWSYNLWNISIGESLPPSKLKPLSVNIKPPIFNNHLVVKNATLKTPYINYLKSITLIDCHIQSPEGGHVIDIDGGQCVVDANGKFSSNGIVIVPDNTTGITSPEASATATVQEIYSLDGSRQPRMQCGVNIVKMSDGTTRKVVCRQ
ncbi:hypothetical protein [Prevotella sp. HUN102]|uniref:hypothetical protein n=1 Tax=Prevotella sp. HUN102 TaxID=1392486 RepID=UPI00048B8E0C|nr:hypothetical protein [Prevotella sp. HUN102]